MEVEVVLKLGIVMYGPVLTSWLLLKAVSLNLDLGGKNHFFFLA